VEVRFAITTALVVLAATVALSRGGSPGGHLLVQAASLTALPGSEYGAAISPDGRQVAFFWDNPEGKSGIYLGAIGSDAVTPLVTLPGQFNYSPAWSPDGKTIAFLRRTKTNETWLCLISASGEAERVLAPLASPGQFFYSNHSHLSWTADGRWIYAPMSDETRRGIYRISAASGEAQQVTASGNQTDFAAVLSPDGRTLAFIRAGSTRQGWVEEVLSLPLAPNGGPQGATQVLSRESTITSGLAWTPSGKDLLLCKADGDYSRLIETRLWRLPVRPGQRPSPTALTDCFTAAVSPTIHSGRATLVFGSKRKSKVTLWQSSLPALDSASPFAASSREDSLPSFSPAGDLVSFSSDRSGTLEIWIARRNGLEARRITNGAKPGSGSHWSPDGSRLLYFSAGHLFAVPVAGGSPRSTPVEFQAADFSWSTQWLYFKQGAQIFRMRHDGSERSLIVQAPARIKFMSQSADGKRIFYSRGGDSVSLCSVPVEGGPEEIVSTGLFDGSFTLSKRFAYFASHQDQALYRQPLQGGVSVRLGALPGYAAGRPGANGFGMTVAPDDSAIVYAISPKHEVDLLVVNNLQ
jgi:Tol biopolymer transport system component